MTKRAQGWLIAFSFSAAVWGGLATLGYYVFSSPANVDLVTTASVMK